MDKIRLYGVVLLTGLAFGGPVHPETLMDRPVSQLFEESSLLVEGKIIGVEGKCFNRTCPATYEMQIDREYKGATDKKVIFCSYRPLTLGERYVVFMEANDGAQKNSQSCSFVAMIDGVFTEGVTGIYYRYMSLDGLNRQIKIDGSMYLTYLICEPNFGDFISTLKERRTQ